MKGCINFFLLAFLSLSYVKVQRQFQLSFLFFFFFFFLGGGNNVQ